MKSILHKATTRGNADHGWLKSYHTFSFADYHNPDRHHFGALRVLNDDWVAPEKGFGMHAHDNMEIITIPLQGTVEHKDSIGNTGTISAGEIQVMSAGQGIYHSEFNREKNVSLSLLQIWILPDSKNVTPRYDQISISEIVKENELYQILSPSAHDQGVWIHQQAWFSLGNFTKECGVTYSLHNKESGVYIFVIEGNVTVMGNELNRRDGIGIWEISEIQFSTSGDTQLLLMEIPMRL
jgi:redox-sensitive bicupin YhaK (pirin superfamily)